MKGLTTILDHKKWVFAYFIVILLTFLLKAGDITGAEYIMVLMATVPMAIGANSFDKSEWRTRE